MSNLDAKDKKESRTLLLFLSIIAIIFIAGIILLLPQMNDMLAIHFIPGLGFKDAAIISFFVTLIMMVVLTIASGDGIIGEIQFLLIGFIVFFIIIWLMLAWVF